MDPITDPRANGPIPASVARREVWLLRGELACCADAWDRLASHPDPDLRAAAQASSRVLRRCVNVACATPTPRGWRGLLSGLLRALIDA